jgi:hypothetical protein
VGNRLKRFELLGYAAGLSLVLALVTITSSLLLGSTQSQTGVGRLFTPKLWSFITRLRVRR